MYLISCERGEWDDYSSLPILVTRDIDTAKMLCEEMEKDNGNKFRKYALSVLGETSFSPDVSFSFQEIGEFSL